jgi:hypothetical protein
MMTHLRSDRYTDFRLIVDPSAYQHGRNPNSSSCPTSHNILNSINFVLTYPSFLFYSKTLVSHRAIPPLCYLICLGPDSCFIRTTCFIIVTAINRENAERRTCCVHYNSNPTMSDRLTRCVLKAVLWFRVLTTFGQSCNCQ